MSWDVYLSSGSFSSHHCRAAALFRRCGRAYIFLWKASNTGNDVKERWKLQKDTYHCTTTLWLVKRRFIYKIISFGTISIKHPLASRASRWLSANEWFRWEGSGDDERHIVPETQKEVSSAGKLRHIVTHSRGTSAILHNFPRVPSPLQKYFNNFIKLICLFFDLFSLPTQPLQHCHP